MTLSGHDLMESASPDREANTVDDAESPSRKRPRLDIGPSVAPTAPSGKHSMQSSNPTTPLPADLTIRSQPSSSTTQPTDPPDGDPSCSGASAMDDPQASPLIIAEEDDLATSPPVIAIEDDDDSSVAAFDFVTDSFHFEPYFMAFPWAAEQPEGVYDAAARRLGYHFANGNHPLDLDLLQEVTRWLSGLPDSPLSFPASYLDKQVFWDEFGGMVRRLLGRRHKLGVRTTTEATISGQVVARFLQSYVTLCLRFMRIDLHNVPGFAPRLIPDHGLLNYVHVRNLFDIIMRNANIFATLASECRLVDDNLILPSIRAVIENARLLFAYATSISCKSSTATLWITAIICVVGMHVSSSAGNARSRFAENALQYFQSCDIELQEPSQVVDVGVIKELLQEFACLLEAMCRWDPDIASGLADSLLPLSRADSPTRSPDEEEEHRLESYRRNTVYRPALVANAWKFKLLRKYMIKGRMELRVAAVATMNSSFVSIWALYNRSTEGCEGHPVMQYMADFILREKIIDFIISVDSHPQLIQRSGNIVGFLAVTSRYTPAQTDAIWQTISNSQDPRVVHALVHVVHHMHGLLQPPSQVTYHFSKLFSLPIESCTAEMLHFLDQATNGFSQAHFDWNSVDPSARPWNVCIRIMQDTPPSRESTQPRLNLHHEAAELLQRMSGRINREERERILLDCASNVEQQTPKATGSIRAMCILGSLTLIGETFFQRHSDIVRHILEELCSFVDEETRQDPYPLYPDALGYRLDMLRYLIQRAPDTIPATSQQNIWEHTVGKYALDNQTRDYAWGRFTECTKYKPVSRFCQELISSYVPEIEPQHFTRGMFNFVASYEFPLCRQMVGERDLIQIPGGDLLTRMVLTAPEGTIEIDAAQLLASRYVQVNSGLGVTVQDVENSHIALAKKCTQDLLSDYKALRGAPNQDDPAETGDSMDISMSDSARQQRELRFCRTLLIEHFLLQVIKTKPNLQHARQPAAVDALESETNYGEIIKIKISTGAAEKRTLEIGLDNILSDLEKRVCKDIGYTKVNIFGPGHKMNCPEAMHKELKTFKNLTAPIASGADAFVLVQKAADGENAQGLPAQYVGRSAFETAILDHFDELYACMDSDDRISAELFEFFRSLPFHPRIPDKVASGQAAPEEIFPPEKPFQAQYAALAIRQKLKDHLRKGTLDDSFLLNSVQLFDKALLETNLGSEACRRHHEFDLAHLLVVILLEFLKERPAKDISSRYFSNPASLVGQLMKLIDAGLELRPENCEMVWNAYAAILEASLHSREVWEAFTHREDLIKIHRNLLLVHERRDLREHVVKSITSVCELNMPATSPLTEADTAATFWKIVAGILPETVRYPTQSEHLFDIAEKVFRGHDRYHRNEKDLQLCLSNWGALLSSSRHDEFVGRNESDFVVRGFTRLLHSCVLSLKSYKKPLKAGSLIKTLWQKFLFVSRVVELDRGGQLPDLPVLQSDARKELFDLLLALAEDHASFGVLLEMASSVATDEHRLYMLPYNLDREDLIRSPTGYAGLNNPRAICYMNSLLTQLFMNLNFRKFMLGLNIADSDNSQRLLSATQALFAGMQNMVYKHADPQEFASCVRAIEGGPIDVNIQMDADEFYNLLFDQWEGQMLSAETKQQFRSFYGGQTVNQIKSKECEHVSERVESFFVVQCDVQGKRNLQESLQAFIEGDVMEGDNKYRCESCGGKYVDAVKRTCLKDVPDNLIFHLKRFDFDLVNMTRAKINDYFEFPLEIDVSAYNVEHLSDPSKPREPDVFELVGVLVHTGTSENGHYYSYIRERPSPPGSAARWVEFNDREVTTFDPSGIAFQAFGGSFDDQQFSGQQKQFSAYMLFYQRREAIVKDRQQYITSPDCGPPKVPLPPELEAKINADNELFLREYTLLDANHSRFVKQLLGQLENLNKGTCSEEHKTENEALHIALEHLSSAVIRQRNTGLIEDSLFRLRRAVLSCWRCCHTALKYFGLHGNALTGLLTMCPHPRVRFQARQLLIECLKDLRDKEASLYFGVDSAECERDPTQPVRGIAGLIVRRLGIITQNCWGNCRGWDDLFSTLSGVARMGHVEVGLLLDSNMLNQFLEVFCLCMSETTAPELLRFIEKKKFLLTPSFEFVYLLLSHMDIRLPRWPDCSERANIIYPEGSKYALTEDEWNFLTMRNHDRLSVVLHRLLDAFDASKSEVFYPGEVLKWLLQSEDINVQRTITQTLRFGITTEAHPQLENYMRAIIPYVEVCPHRRLVQDIIDSLAKCAAQISDVIDGADAVVEALHALLGVEAESWSQEGIVKWELMTCRSWAMALLTYENEIVRNAEKEHLAALFGRGIGTHDEEMLELKFAAVRSLLKALIHKIQVGYQDQAAFTAFVPLVEIGRMLAGILKSLQNEPELQEYRENGDLDLIRAENSVHQLITSWPEEGTSQSTEEGYGDSEYQSDSDELLEDLPAE